ncbi:hypothetical protein [Rahnella woolbedingensis]|uniref:Uncharacterized protein n=1 Tax=Rahnella woolbedingensis TaxID=1510574 RepID=A0A419NCF0_9GAMM|nr:hypothetical protein [Rahnella woolbedingensis]RJT46017.1 hypothetical protein D6C13_04860 [Rahnella woolbedingensis]
MDLDMDKLSHLSPRQIELVELVVGFLRYCDEKHKDDVKDNEIGGVLNGPPEAFYHPRKSRKKQR